MDTWGFLLAGIGLVGALTLKKESLKRAAWWVCGVGCGIVAGAIWAVQIVNGLIP